MVNLKKLDKGEFMSGNLIYKEPEKMTKEQILAVLQSNDVAAIENALVSLVFFEEDFEFAKKLIFNYAKNSDEAIRGTAILCIGHLARIHKNLPIEITIEIIEGALKDNSHYVREQAESAASDINVYIPDIGCRIKGRTIPFVDIDEDD